ARVRNIADFLGEAREAGCWSYGASAPVREPEDADRHGARPGGGVAVGVQRSGGAATVSYTAPDYSGGVVLVLGSEGSGLRPRVAGACDQLVSLPLRGRIESLGVAAAAAALLYGILQSREAGLDKAP
ncbi:MAG TPA: TrmH family RNA methyltransferase, partial [Solirubrobacteraceae bacterium]|nr:TrmH family RNA methyltransferase [Solirubrobacteraceae bacterium]